MKALQKLHIGVNELTGTIPTELGSLSNLKQLFLQVDLFNEMIPTELFELEQWTWLDQ